ncbi:Calcyclin-binding protein [Plecturocebus cupreus]
MVEGGRKLISVFLVETGFRHVGQGGLELLISSDLPAWASEGAGITRRQPWGPQTGFHHVGQAGLELLTSSDPPALTSQSAGITGMNHCTWLELSFLYDLQKDLEEVKVLLEKASRKRIRDALTAEKSKIETEIKNKMQQKSQKKAELLDNEKPAAVVAPMTTGYTVKISNYGWDQSDKFVKIYITLTGVHQVPTENVQVHFTERSFDLLVKNLNGKSYSMIVNNLLKPISVEGSSKKVKTDTVLILCRKKVENTRWDYLTQVEKECKEKEKPSYDTETDPSEGLMNVLKKIYEDGDDDMKRTINKAWVESREKQAKGDTEF